MHRRRLLATAAAAILLPGASSANYTATSYTPEVWRDMRDQDTPVILNFRASWSLTCQIKADLIADLRSENLTYARLTIIDVDWDTFGPSQLVKRLKVDRRSTLLVMKRGKEVARLVNEPYRRKLQTFFDTALAV